MYTSTIFFLQIVTFIMLRLVLQKQNESREKVRARTTLDAFSVHTKRVRFACTKNSIGLIQNWEKHFNDYCPFCGLNVKGYRGMAGHIKGCRFMKNDNGNDESIEDNGYYGFLQETEEDHVNTYLYHQEIASSFEALPRAYPILLSNGSRVTPNWFHYLEIAKFGKLLC